MENVMKVKQFFLFVSSETPSSPPSTHNLLEAFLVQLKEWLSVIPNLFFSLLRKLNDAFPPEARAQWLATATPYLIAGAVFLSLFLFLCCCLPLIFGFLSWVAATCWATCTWVFTGLWRTCCCCCRRSGRFSGRTMKGPGTGGLYRLPRSRFEANPRGYFESLRAGTLPVTHR